MSDDKDKKKKDQEYHPPTKVEPVPKDPAFFEWLETLFNGETQFPEKLTIRVVTGKDGDRPGPMIKQLVYAPGDYKAGAPKPARDKIVALSNEIIGLCQDRVNQIRKPQMCGVFASHFSREVDYYESRILRFNPSKAGLLTVNAKDPDEAPDDEDSMEKRFSVQILKHHERMFDTVQAATENLIDRYDRDKVRDNDEISRLREENHRLREENERALSLKDERDRKRLWTEVGVKAADKGVNLAMDMAPAFLAHLTGKSLPGGKSPESITLANFFKTTDEGGLLTQAQAEAAFGKWDDTDMNRLIKPGVLTVDQGQILFKVSTCEFPVEKLFEVMPGSGGPHEITMQQVIALRSNCGFDEMAQLAPLLALFNTLDARRQKQAAQAK